MELHRWDADCDGALSEQSLADRLRALGYEVNRYVYPPGTRFPTHTHAVDKIDAVLTGRLRIVMAGRTFELGVGDWLEVPRDVPHSAEVIGAEAVLSLDAVRR